MSSSLLPPGSGPEVGGVDRVALEGPATFVDESVVEAAEPGGVVECARAAMSSEADVVQLDHTAAAAGERALTAVA